MCIIITLAFQATFDNMADDYKLKCYRLSLFLRFTTKHNLSVKLMDTSPPLSILKVPSVKEVLFVFCCT